MIRTFLTFFLERDIKEMRERNARQIGPDLNELRA
jgi:hypothetical protein